MIYFLFAVPLALYLTIRLVSAQAGSYAQCGGQGWSGSTTCVSGYACTVVNQYYSQCLPGTGPTPLPPITSAPAPPPSTILPPTPTTPVLQPPSTTVVGPPPTGSQIRGVTSRVYHFYLQNNAGVPRLGPEASSGRFIINGTITLNQSNGSRLFLNADDIGAAYKPLSFGTTATTTNWGLEGDTIIIRNPRQLNFLACSTSDRQYYDVFLQGNGNGSPPGRTCSMITMHLPCLC